MKIFILLLLWTGIFSQIPSNKNLALVMEFCTVVAHGILHKKCLPAHQSDRSFLPKRSPHHGIFADILQNPPVLSNQTECCFATIVVTSGPTNMNNRCGREVSKQQLLFFYADLRHWWCLSPPTESGPVTTSALWVNTRRLQPPT